MGEKLRQGQISGGFSRKSKELIKSKLIFNIYSNNQSKDLHKEKSTWRKLYTNLATIVSKNRLQIHLDNNPLMNSRCGSKHSENGGVFTRFRHQSIQSDVFNIKLDSRPFFSFICRVQNVTCLGISMKIFDCSQYAAVVTHIEEIEVFQCLMPCYPCIWADEYSVVTLNELGMLIQNKYNGTISYFILSISFNQCNCKAWFVPRLYMHEINLRTYACIIFLQI